MKSIKLIRFSALLAAVVLSGLLFTQCAQGSKEAEAQVVKSVNSADKIYPVKVIPIASERIARTIDYTSTLIPWEEVYLASAQPGRIEKIYVEVGDEVAQGDLIAELDPTQLIQAKIQLGDARLNFNRLDTLIQVGGVSRQQYDQVKMQLQVLESNVEFLEKNTRLTSPVSGVVTGKYYEDNELFSGAPNTQAGKAAIVTLQQINPLKAIVNVSEKYYPLVYNGMKAQVICDTYPDKIFSGEVSLIHPTVNSLTRTFTVEVTVPNVGRILRSGMFSRVQLALGEEDAIVLPAQAILQQEGTNERFVFVHRNHVAHRINVETGKRFDDKIEVISPELHIGDQLIIAGQVNLLDGYKVEVSAQ
ncbi:MAG: efflux RND transporter periplasmic adaptor subunit [Bacteroidales bacterium]|nr:efflux RND transporter periplasmic adaptor subunit [Bacteroidales bacterium]MDD3961503.1 efflux RND transporter periplasmic adaptor subunit [Bacteroidales bacterium]